MCPDCGWDVAILVDVCPFCGHEFTEEDIIIYKEGDDKKDVS